MRKVGLFRPRSLVPDLHSLPELIDKMATLDFEVKSLKHITTAAEDKCDALERKVVESAKSTAQTRQLLADLEEHLRLQNTLAAIQSVNGHLVWRIPGFTDKLRAAKENELTLQSPLFCNRPYGYTLRVSCNYFKAISLKTIKFYFKRK